MRYGVPLFQALLWIAGYRFQSDYVGCDASCKFVVFEP